MPAYDRNDMTFPVSRRAALPALALAISATFAHGAQATETINSIVVTAARAPRAGADVLSDHLVLTSADIERSGAGNVVDLLQKQRGVEVARNGGPGTSASVYLRGGDAKQTVVLVDGVRIGSSTTGVAGWSALALASIDHIEIVYGPLATLYGADAIGGVVQLFTKRGAGNAQLTAGIAAGSKNARSYDARIAGGTGSLSYSVVAAHEANRGFSATKPGNFSYNPDHDGYRKDSLSAQLGFLVSPGHEAGLLFMHSKLDAQYDNGAASFDARGKQKLQNLAVYSSHQFTPSTRIKVQLSRADDKSVNFSNASATGASSLNTLQTGGSIQGDFALGSDLLQMVLEHRGEDVASSSTPALARGRDTDSGALSYSLKRGAHLASASARVDDSSQYGTTVTGGLGYGYRVTPSLRLSASAGTSFRAPTFNELYFPGFGVASNRPEKGRNVEAGVAYNAGVIEATAVYYRNRLTDLLVNTPRCPVDVATHPFGCAYNVNRATLSGLSVGVRARLAAFDISGALDLQDPQDDTSGKQLVRRAKRHASLAAEYNVGALAAGIGVQASSRRFDDTANRNAMGGYGLLNLFASYRFAPDWSAQLKWNNAAGKRYELARNYATAGSQVFVGLRYGAR